MNNKTNYLTLFILLCIVAVGINSCVQDDDFSTPPLTGCNTDENFYAVNKTLGDLVNLTNGDAVEITEDFVFDAYVSSSDLSGNIFKQLYIQDQLENPENAIVISIDASNLSNLYPQGSKIRINAKGLFVGKRNESLQLAGDAELNRISDLVFESNIYKTCDDIQQVTPLEVGNIADAKQDKYVNKLIVIKNVQFADSEIGNTYATGGSNPQTENRILVDASGEVIVRNSGYADFADELLPEGSGQITAILSRYNDDYQLYIIDTGDVSMENERLFLGFNETFDTLNNWTTVSVTGSQAWEISSYRGENFAKMSGYSGGNNENEDWLISNAIALPNSLTSATISFDTAKNYNGNDLEAFYSTDYNGNPSTATWTTLNPTLSTGNFTFINSGNLDVSSAIGNNLYIAFKYTSTSSASATWEVDNVVLTAE
ncbi:MAG: choice-of-anchor J domain-containing protein [Flavobacteriales bacterium]|nr:choice-of-anchor J domain-containing protein [Flavobacteriales bacterium]